MTQLTKEQAIKAYESQIWLDMTDQQIAEAQLFQDRLFVPFDVFHKAVEVTLGRPVYTYEFGLDRAGLQKEFLGQRPTPSFEDVIGLIPKEKLLVINLNEPTESGFSEN